MNRIVASALSCSVIAASLATRRDGRPLGRPRVVADQVEDAALRERVDRRTPRRPADSHPPLYAAGDRLHSRASRRAVLRLPAALDAPPSAGSGLWRGAGEASPRAEFLYYTAHGEIEGIREGRWKLLVKRPQRGKQVAAGAAAVEPQVLLFDLEADLGEQTNLAERHPDLVARLRERMLSLDGEITANARPEWTRRPAAP
jgi:hypothetical protein